MSGCSQHVDRGLNAMDRLRGRFRRLLQQIVDDPLEVRVGSAREDYPRHLTGLGLGVFLPAILSSR